jgi:hypothetical protein
MADGSILELASLPTRHPRVSILEQFGAHVILRLSFDPIELKPEVQCRQMIVDRKTARTAHQEVQETHTVGWQGLAGFSRDYCLKVQRTSNQNSITEAAAIGIMALLIHELEGGVIVTVLPIGSGGDYLIAFEENDARIQVEVSGIRVDRTGHEAKSRLREKSDQVLKKSLVGYASVTTFQRAQDESAHSFLHYVEAK